ncbi:MAG: 2-amino-4-hydroxy-6-hydroxymethyldihydropteridine diphosphokinase [Gammaproteobacteria bacterium HGW-Gammaproteobacteria-3]|jgi:2-amino-4-hydroxy-6-hydroxymethyldihydropteridine diphosphokinase|nr:MAG: 2-amino-4-hydroxy-6-hydroxymethyldihydropteridine diphosphokinase [Gammaproteobacteria bacterium HGW-Gammaproteobacteria-3]
MPRCYVSIGSNIDKELHIPSCLRALERYFGKLTLSSVYETEAIGFNGDNFYNLAVGFDTDLPILRVAEILRQIELAHGRTRNCKKFSARTLDIDLLLYGDLITDDGTIQIPRHEIERYAFVLEPLAEIAPDLQHPVNHQSYAEIWQHFDRSQTQQKRIQPPWRNM